MPLHAMFEKQLNIAQFFIAQNEMIVSLSFMIVSRKD